MKKVLALIVVVLSMFSTLAIAEVDLSGMSYEELVALKDRINLAIWNSEEWQEVTVPQGIWVVGEDIPAGHWTIKCIADTNAAFVYVVVSNKLDNTGKKVMRGGDFWAGESIYNPDSSYTQKKLALPVIEWDIELFDGLYVEVNYEAAIFTPYSGKPSLGFK